MIWISANHKSDVVITNNHALPCPDLAKNISLDFNYLKDNEPPAPGKADCNPDMFFATSVKFDATVVAFRFANQNSVKFSNDSILFMEYDTKMELAIDPRLIIVIHHVKKGYLHYQSDVSQGHRDVFEQPQAQACSFASFLRSGCPRARELDRVGWDTVEGRHRQREHIEIGSQ